MFGTQLPSKVCLQPLCIPAAESILLHPHLDTPSGSVYWDTGNADVTRLRRYLVACAQPKSCWRSQPSSSKARGGPILVRKLHMHCCMLYEPLQVLAQHLICCLHKLELCERKATPDSEFLVHLGQLAAFCLLLSACCFAGKLAYYARQPPCFAIKFELPRRSLLQALLTTQP